MNAHAAIANRFPLPDDTLAILQASAFSTARTPRSDAYKAGHYAALVKFLGDGPLRRCPYANGTAEADAWYAGYDEGRATAAEVRK